MLWKTLGARFFFHRSKIPMPSKYYLLHYKSLLIPIPRINCFLLRGPCKNICKFWPLPMSPKSEYFYTSLKQKLVMKVIYIYSYIRTWDPKCEMSLYEKPQLHAFWGSSSDGKNRNFTALQCCNVSNRIIKIVGENSLSVYCRANHIFSYRVEIISKVSSERTHKLHSYL